MNRKRLIALGGWCLLAAVLTDPAWAVAHAALHHEHGAHASSSDPIAWTPDCHHAGDHDHPHADAFQALQTKLPDHTPKARPAAAPGAIDAPSTARVYLQPERCLSRARPGHANRAAPRAPPLRPS